MKIAIFLNITIVLSAVMLVPSASLGAGGIQPIADAGLSRYTGTDPVVLDGTHSYDPDDSGPLGYTWRQIDGPSVVIIDTNTPTPIDRHIAANDIAIQRRVLAFS